MATSAYPITTAWALVYDPAVSGNFTGSIGSGGAPVYVRVASSIPGPSDIGMPINERSDITLSADRSERLYARVYSGASYLVLDTSMIGVQSPFLPLLTDQGGNNARLRVDDGQTGFFDGKEFRSFLELSIGAGTTQVVRFSSPVNFILWSQDFSVDAGSLRFAAVLNGTPGGSFATPLPVIGKNRMTTAPVYVAQATIATGGTITGGTEVEVVRIIAANATAQQQTVGFTASERGLPAGDYYLKFQNIASGTLTGGYALSWEERP